MKTILWLVLVPLAAAAQAPVEYDVSFNNAAHHEARITVTWRDIDDDVLQVRMSRSSPGRYAVHEFAKNVYNVWVVNSHGEPLEITRPDPYQWDVRGHDGVVSVTYTLYADRAGGTYSGIDLSHAHLNMPATFMWARGYDDRPITITFNVPDPDWKAATQLVPTDDPYVFTAPNLQYFFDSPTELSNFALRTWQVTSAGKNHTFRLAVHHDGTDDDVDAFLVKAQKVVNAQLDIFGELADYDYGTYTFIADYLSYASGDGMEHRNSTVIVNPQSFVEADFGQLGTLSHEFIHSWNVERIRPASLEPFDFERANMSDNLWFAEGFTSYYGVLAIHRADESSLDEFAKSLAYWIDTVTNSPGRKFASAAEMSMQAPFVDAATAIDPTNFDNTFISYYTWGAALGVALDLALRDRFEGVTLDTLMREMWASFGKTEIPYTNDDIRRSLAKVTGNERFANEFFTRYILGHDLPDYRALLDRAGLVLQPVHPDTATLGPVSFTFDGKDAIIGSNTIIGSPLYDAGLDRGDQILAVDRLKITSQARWDNALSRYQPGDTATIRYLQRGTERSAEIRFVSDPSLEIVPVESTGTDPTAAQQAFRQAWLGGAD